MAAAAADVKKLQGFVALNEDKPGGQQPKGLAEPFSATYSFSMVAWWRSCSKRNWFWRFHLVLEEEETERESEKRGFLIKIEWD